MAKEFVTDTLLVSAFDLYHGLIPAPGPVVQLLFVDSGGYETNAADDLAAYALSSPATAPWDERLHEETLAGWPAEIPAVFVSFDRYQSFDAQIKRAAEQVERFPKQLHALLLKPERAGSGPINPFALGPHARELNRFNIIGVTEKELGNSVLDRVRNLATLRTLLDDNGVHSPIHVFGGLDPLTVILYYVAGAEIFDGLTWLRYGFVDGIAVYRENFNVLRTPLDALPLTARSHMLTANLAHLQQLAHLMREYQHTSDVRVFAPHERIVEQVTRQIALWREEMIYGRLRRWRNMEWNSGRGFGDKDPRRAGAISQRCL